MIGIVNNKNGSFRPNLFAITPVSKEPVKMPIGNTDVIHDASSSEIFPVGNVVSLRFNK